MFLINEKYENFAKNYFKYYNINYFKKVRKVMQFFTLY